MRAGLRAIDAAPLRRRSRPLSAAAEGFEAPAVFRAVRRKRVLALAAAECVVGAADEEYFEMFGNRPTQVDEAVDPLSECGSCGAIRAVLCS